MPEFAGARAGSLQGASETRPSPPPRETPTCSLTFPAEVSTHLEELFPDREGDNGQRTANPIHWTSVLVLISDIS